MGLYSSSETTKALKEIQVALADRLKEAYPSISPRERDIKVEEILKIHGLNEDKFNVIDNFESILEAQTISDVSVDDNSNKHEVGISGSIYESITPYRKLVGYRNLYRAIKKEYGKEEAKRLSGLMYDFTLALSDSSKIMIPYCWAGDFSSLITAGRSWGQLHSTPAKTLRSYIGALNETVHSLSNHLAGAVAVASFFTDSAKVLMDCEEITLEELKENKSVRKHIENSFQSFVHSMNSLTRTGAVESPFTNISIFDRAKNLQKAKDLDFFFDRKDPEYIADYLMELQRIYMDFFSKGDPTKNGIMYRFPVSTINITKDENNNIVDKDFLEEVVRQEIFRYNIFVSESSKDASCCRMLSSEEMLALGAQSNSFGGGGVGQLGSHRVITVDYFRLVLMNETFDDYMKSLLKSLDDSCKILKAHRQMILDLQEKGFQPFIDRGYINMSRMFSTFGILGIVEGADIAQKKYKVNKDTYTRTVLEAVNKATFGLANKYQMPINVEQIPAESMSHRIPNVNRILFGKRKCPYPLFANQFIPMWEDASLWERMEVDGKYGKMFTGGGIVHFSLGERTLPAQNKKIIEYAIKTGCEHFSLNPIYSVCEDCGNTKFAKLTSCDQCGSDNIEYYTRTVGFFTPVKAGWSKPKQEHDFNKRTFKSIEV